ncbi:hypothetical protein P9112_003652 [Eukaryota sp. TZLM1-RC]
MPNIQALKGHPLAVAVSVALERCNKASLINLNPSLHTPLQWDRPSGTLFDFISILHAIDPSLFPQKDLSTIYNIANISSKLNKAARLHLAHVSELSVISPDLVNDSLNSITSTLSSLQSYLPTSLPSTTDLTAADLIIFSSIFPFFSFSSTFYPHASTFPHLSNYFSHLTSLSVIHSAMTLSCPLPELLLSSLRQTLTVSPHEQVSHTITKASKQPVYISTPIYYVNGTPHIGHVYTTLLCDVVSRWYKTRGDDVYFQTGTDEHGQKVAQTAEQRGITPKEMCDEISTNFRSVFDLFDFNYDRFIRTTDEDHEKAVIHMWNLLYNNGHIYKGVHEGWYAVSDEAFLTESQVEDKEVDGKVVKVSKESGNVVVRFKEENYMFRLSSFQDKLLEFYNNNAEFIVPKYRHSEVVAFISSGLQDISVSRANVKWGIPVPNDPSHTIYVWIDALTNYLTGTGFPSKSPSWPCDYHVLGKDITRFHAIYWPAMLMGAGIELPKKLVVHGWWTANKAKISKSLGNVFDPIEVANIHGLDSLRYFLCREASLSSDGDYSEFSMVARKNADLADSFGNLVCRALSPALNKEQKIPVCGQLTVADQEVADVVSDLVNVFDLHMIAFNTQNALKEVFRVVGVLNKYIMDQAPWKLLKQEGTRDRVDTILYVLIESLRLIGCCLWCVMPSTIDLMFDQLGVPQNLRNGVENFKFGLLPCGLEFGSDRKILFEKSVLKSV